MVNLEHAARPLGPVAAPAGQEIRVGGHKPFTERRSAFQPRAFRRIRRAASVAVRPARGVKYQSSLEPDNLGDHVGEFANRDVLAGSHIEEVIARIVLHQEHAGIAEVVGGEELRQTLPLPQTVALG